MKMVDVYINDDKDPIQVSEYILDYIGKNFTGKTFDEKFEKCLSKALYEYTEREKLKNG